MKKIVIGVIIILLLIVLPIILFSNETYILNKSKKNVTSFINSSATFLNKKNIDYTKDNITIFESNIHAKYTSNLKHSKDIITDKDFTFILSKNNSKFEIVLNNSILNTEIPKEFNILMNYISNSKSFINIFDNIKFSLKEKDKIVINDKKINTKKRIYELNVDNVNNFLNTSYSKATFIIYTAGLYSDVVKYEFILDNEIISIDNYKVINLMYDTDKFDLKIKNIKYNNFLVELDYSNNKLKLYYSDNETKRISGIYNEKTFNIVREYDNIIFSISKNEGRYSNFNMIVTPTNKIKQVDYTEYKLVDDLLIELMSEDIYNYFTK